MRWALRVIAALAVVLITVGTCLLGDGQGVQGSAPYFVLLAGDALTVVTLLLGLFISSNRQQRRWLLALLLAISLGVAGSPLSWLVISARVSYSALPASCQPYYEIGYGMRLPPQACLPPLGPLFTLVVPFLIGFAAVILIGLVALAYSFRMGDTADVRARQ